MEKVIRSKPGWKLLFELTLGGACLGGTVWGFGGIIQVPLTIWVIFIAIGSVFFVFMPYRVTVSRDYCRVDRFIRPYSQNMKKVTRISIAPLALSDPMLMLETSEGDFLPQIQRMANYTEMAKAIIEASYLSSPDVKLDDWVVQKFGRPPYGIFNK